MAVKDTLTPARFREELKTLNLAAIARKYGVTKQYITQLHNEYKLQYPELFAEPVISSQWLKEQLESHTILEICNMTGKSYHNIRKLMAEYGIEKPTTTATLDKDYVREQYVTLYRSDKELARHYGCSVSLVKKFRYEHSIFKTDRAPLTERLSKELAIELLGNGHTAETLVDKFDATHKEILRLLKSYEIDISLPSSAPAKDSM